MTKSNSALRTLTKADFKVPALLLGLSLVPTLGAVVRLMSMSPGTTLTPDNARFLTAPAPVVGHVVCATLYALLGAFQFTPALRLHFPKWHRSAGKLLVFAGLGAAATGLWMTVFYPIPNPLQGSLLYGVRVVVASAMMVSLLIGWWSILGRQVARHEAFMIRAYALGQGAGTQVLVLLPWMLISGDDGGLTRDVLMTLAWLINVAVGESIIHTRSAHGLAARRSPRP